MQVPLRFVPPLALMALIFYLSAQPDLSSGLEWDRYLRKVGHMAVFGLLALLWWRALGRAGIAAAIAIAYGITDEWHQSFVEGRTGSPVDVLINSAGVMLAIAAVRASRARWR